MRLTITRSTSSFIIIIRRRFVTNLVASLRHVTRTSIQVRRHQPATRTLGHLPQHPILRIRTNTILTDALSNITLNRIRPQVTTQVRARQAVSTFTIIRHTRRTTTTRRIRQINIHSRNARMVIHQIRRGFFQRTMLSSPTILRSHSPTARLRYFVRIITSGRGNLTRLTLRLRRFILRALASRQVRYQGQFIRRRGVNIRHRHANRTSALLRAPKRLIKLLITPLNRARRLRFFVSRFTPFFL